MVRFARRTHHWMSLREIFLLANRYQEIDAAHLRVRAAAADHGVTVPDRDIGHR